MADAGDIRAGRSFVELGIRDLTQKGLEAAKTRLEGFSKSISGFSQRMSGYAEQIGKFFGGNLVDAAKASAEKSREFIANAAKIGTSVENYTTLAYAAEQVQVETEDLVRAMYRLNIATAAAADGGKGQQDAFDRLGISYSALSQMTPVDKIAALADGLAKIENPARRADIAFTLLGKGGAQVFPLLNRGGDAVRQFAKDAKDFGRVVGSDGAKAAAEYGLQLKRMEMALKGPLKAIAGNLIPALTDQAKRTTEVLIPITKWIKEHKELTNAVAGSVSVLLVGSASLALLSTGFAKAAAAIGLVQKPLMVVGGLVAKIGLRGSLLGVAATVGAYALGKSTGQAGVIPTLSAGAGKAGAAAFDYLTTGETVASRVFMRVGSAAATAFHSVRETAETTAQAVSAAWSRGDWGLAFQVTAAGVKLEFAKLTGELQLGWISTTAFMQTTWVSFSGYFAEAGYSISDTANAAWVMIQKGWVNLTSYLIGDWESYTAYFAATWEVVSNILMATWDALKAAFGAAAGAIYFTWDKTTSLIKSAWDATIGAMTSLFEMFGVDVNAIIEKIKSAWETVATLFGKVAGPIRKALEPILNFVSLPKQLVNIARGRGLTDTDPEEVQRQRRARLAAIDQAQAGRDAANAESRDAARQGRDERRDAIAQAREDDLARARKAGEDRVKQLQDQLASLAKQAAPSYDENSPNFVGPKMSKGKGGPTVTDIPPAIDQAMKKTEAVGTFFGSTSGLIGATFTNPATAAGQDETNRLLGGIKNKLDAQSVVR